MQKQKVIIIGSGPAGLTAAIYASRAGLNPLVISGKTPGGQLMLTTEVENYPGFPEGILGPDLMAAMRKQAERFDAQFIDDDIASVTFTNRPLKVHVGQQMYAADAVIVATGAQAKWLGFPNEQRLIGKGVSSCAVCDAFFFKDKKAVVVGGGDTAMEEALVLTKFAATVTVVHRRDTLRASKIMQDRAKANSKISFLWNTVVTDVLGQEKVTGVRLKNLERGQESELDTDAVFIAIGYTPATEFLRGQVELDEKGYVKLYNEAHTNVPGVFVAGDVEDFRYRQAVTAAGAGCKAALEAEKYLAERLIA